MFFLIYSDSEDIKKKAKGISNKRSTSSSSDTEYTSSEECSSGSKSESDSKSDSGSEKFRNATSNKVSKVKYVF